MIQFLPSVQDYAQNTAVQSVWNWIREKHKEEEGICYYKYPLIKSANNRIPDLTLLTRRHHPIVVRCLPIKLEDIESIAEEQWMVSGHAIDSPLLELDDFRTGLRGSFDRERKLRREFEPVAVLALPLILQRDFEGRFPNVIMKDTKIVWAGGDVSNLLDKLPTPLTDENWRLVRAIGQGVRPLTKQTIEPRQEATTLGQAFKELEKHIALLDFEQEKVAVSIAPGPQCIRGLAGTGKTVLLAMKAANIHHHYPDKRILFTFNTQSLYNLTKSLITKFYRVHGNNDPDWDVLHIRHGWGSQYKSGVYYDLCIRQRVAPLTLSDARSIDSKEPFKICCRTALKRPIDPYYDFILVDEAQDFPDEFFQILYAQSQEPHCIYWAFDELQTLYSVEVPKAENLFGLDKDGKPRVSFGDDDYPGDIEKEIVLHKSYRCPHKVLMVAHAFGLGLHREDTCVQMLQNDSSWEAIGYKLESGKLLKGEQVVLYRPPESSPNFISDVYKGTQELLTVVVHGSRDNELVSIADSIANDIGKEEVQPEDIIVVCMDAPRSKNLMASLQHLLLERGIRSTIPGLVDDSSAFGESGLVTLSTVFRAKGNEAPLVYIACFDALDDFIAPIESRNKAFTSISRSKAFVRISGVGKPMSKFKDEIDCILKDLPRFKFEFPDMEVIKNLDAETSKRRAAVNSASKSANELLKLDPQILSALRQSDPKMLEELLKKIQEAKGDGR